MSADDGDVGFLCYLFVMSKIALVIISALVALVVILGAPLLVVRLLGGRRLRKGYV